MYENTEKSHVLPSALFLDGGVYGIQSISFFRKFIIINHFAISIFSPHFECLFIVGLWAQPPSFGTVPLGAVR
jgi:hypothetical protein